ncbi:MAG: YmdB family metallophosphoesterase [Cyanobacteria bacterium J06597_1]
MKILFFGDVLGERAVEQLVGDLPVWRNHLGIDLAIANIENSVISSQQNPTYGFGLTLSVVERLSNAGIDVFTGGNHSWDAPESEQVLSLPTVLRPYNITDDLSGTGWLLLEVNGVRFAIVNLMGGDAAPGRYPTTNLYSAFESIDIPEDAVPIVDIHCESAMEKAALAYALDGRAIAVLGTHTHVPSLLMHRLPKGTFYVADVGMNGPSEGVLGMHPDYFVRLMTRSAAVPFDEALGPLQLGAVLIEIDSNHPFDISTGSISRLTSSNWPGIGDRNTQTVMNG